MMLLSSVSAILTLATVVSTTAIGHSPTRTHHVERRAALNPTPSAAGSYQTGWEALPAAPSASIHTDWPMGDAKFALYQSSDRTASDITRAIIVFPGKPRDCWNYWNLANNALILAAEKFEDVKEEEVSVMSPCFLTQGDLDAGSATEGQFLFGLTTWISGQKNTAPEGAEMSSYDVMDSLVDHYMDTTTYPNLKTLVIAGHSAGAQMAQRYATLRIPTKNDDKIHFWIANPGSILWLVEDRPAPDETCEGYDEYKYGLNGTFPAYALGDTNDLGRAGIVERYRGRNIHYAWGLKDHGNGDIRCQAETTGSTHLERGQNFVAMLEAMDGGMPSTSTVDYIEGVSHNATGMMYSDEGLEKLLRYPN